MATRSLVLVRLREDYVRGSASMRVDREAGIIKSVKVLGLASENGGSLQGRPYRGRTYTLEALREALPLFERISVFCNHPRKPGEVRDDDDAFGQLRNVRLAEDGIYADLHFLRSHRLAENLCEAAERMSDLFMMSINADGGGDIKDGRLVVREIPHVESVDIVSRGGTTTSLFESTTTSLSESKGERPVKIKLREWLEKVRRRLDGPPRRAVGRLLEQDDFQPGGEVGAMDMEPPPEEEPPADMGEVDHADVAHGNFADLITALAQDRSLDEADLIKKVVALIKARGKVKGALAGDMPAEGGEEEMEPEPDLEEEGEDRPWDKDKKAMESKQLRARLNLVEAELATLKLCAREGFAPSETLLEALCALPSEQKRRTLIQEAKSQKRGIGPRTAALLEGRPPPVDSKDVPKDPVALGKWLTTN